MFRSIDPDLKYCPSCREEYRPEILACGECGRQLLTGVELQARLGEQGHGPRAKAVITADDPLTPVRQGPVLMIKELQSFLERQGLPSLAVKEGDGACNSGCRGPELLLLVRTVDLPEVAAALEEEHRLSTGLEQHQISRAGIVYDARDEQAVCPACGCCFSSRFAVCPDCGLCFS